MKRMHGLALLIVVIVLALALPALPSTRAQDGGGTPAATPSPPAPAQSPQWGPITEQVTVFGLPFGETFDENRGWLNDGAWQYITDGAYTGGGWYLDGSQRQTISTLSYTASIDLSGIYPARLSFRQKGSLPTTDLIALQISLNGAQSWMSIDEQIGINNDWALRTVDLTAYQGQVIRLRFQVATGAPMTEGEVVTGGYWIDNLSIQSVAPPPPTVAPLPSGLRPTLMGLHVLNGTQREPILALVQRMAATNHPMGTIKGLNGSEQLLAEVKQVSPYTVTVYRSLLTAEGMRDCPAALEENPNNPPDPAQTARTWIDGLQPHWNAVSADYYEVINECNAPTEWLSSFFIEAMKIAEEQGRCILLFSLPGGNPEPHEFEKLLPALRYALDHPCASGRYHGLSLHAYSMQDQLLLSEADPAFSLRHRMFYERILPQLPNVTDLPVYITEAGIGGGTYMLWQQQTCESIVRDIVQYTIALEQDPYIKGFHWWSVGSGTDWFDVTPCLSMIGDAVLNYYGP
jgi:hypothetical protein